MFRIGDLEVQRLSGPISFRYLVPLEKAFHDNAAKGVFLPLIILLGDEHFSEAERCEPCDEEKGCYKVESPTLLTQIDTLAKEIPVDFFNEYSNPDPFPGAGVLTNRFHKETIGCHDTKRRPTPFYKCDYPHTRWHYADVRVWALSTKFESFVNKVENYFNRLYVSNFSHPHPIEVVQADQPRQHDDSRMLHTFMNTLLTAYSASHTVDQFAQRWAKVLSDSILANTNSIIYKQFVKYGLDVNIQLYCNQSIARHLKAYINYNASSLESLIFWKAQPDVQYLSNLIDYMFGESVTLDTDKNLYHQLCINLRNLWISCNASLLDLYFVGRMLKPPRDNINSYLTVAFFGDAHCTDITNFLIASLGWYKLQLYPPFDRLRCSNFTRDAYVDFNQDLKQYTEWRREYQSLSPHLARLEQELVDSQSGINPQLFRKLDSGSHSVDSFTADYLTELFDTDFSPDAVSLLNLIACHVVKALVIPTSDGRPVSFNRVLYSISLHKNSVILSLKKVLEDVYLQQTEQLDPVFVENLIHKCLGPVRMERGVIAAVGNSIQELLQAVIANTRSSGDMIQKKDLLAFLTKHRGFSEKPLAPFEENAPDPELYLTPDFLTRMFRVRFSEGAVALLNTIAKRMVAVMFHKSSHRYLENLVEYLLSFKNKLVRKIVIQAATEAATQSAPKGVIPLPLIDSMIRYHLPGAVEQKTLVAVGTMLTSTLQLIVTTLVRENLTAVKNLIQSKDIRDGLRESDLKDLNTLPFAPFE